MPVSNDEKVRICNVQIDVLRGLEVEIAQIASSENVDLWGEVIKLYEAAQDKLTAIKGIYGG